MFIQALPVDTLGFETIVFDTAVARDHGLGLAFTGMTVVFAGLVLVTLFITYLPRMLERAGRRGQPKPPRTRAADAAVLDREKSLLAMDPDLLAAIGCVLQAEYERELLSDHQLITMREDDEEQKVWTAIGKMRSLATRM
jgi:Na+-transporting methylmalonyl-CoA/oxaloacetate decarboxylase gamma subunit